MIDNFFSMLTDEKISQIHAASLEVLEKTGLKIDHPVALEKLAGAGGFINISQNAARVVFVGTFSARNQVKFVDQVEHRTFSGKLAVKKKQPILYITERCVFELTADGLKLTEIAPGVDIERDILVNMEFSPLIAENLLTMDHRLFEEGSMGIRQSLMNLKLNPLD